MFLDVLILPNIGRGKAAFCSGIRETHPQIKITKADQDTRRFLWKGMNRDIPIQID